MPQPSRPGHAEHLARLMLHSIPEDVRKSIDSAELNDRLVEMARLSAQAQDGALSAPLRAAARNRARAIAEAQPRQVTQRQHAALIAKASATRHPRQAEAIRRQAERLLEEEHPVAPRRAIAKGRTKTAQRPSAKAARLPVVVFGQHRRPLGIVPRSAIVAKASGEKVAMQPVFDENGNLIGIVDPEQIQPVAGSGGKQDAAAAPAGQAPAQAAPAPAAAGQVVKASSLGLPFRTLGEAARERRLARIAKATGEDLRRPHVYARNQFSADGHCICEAPPGHFVHTGIAQGVPVSSGQRRIAKASSWSPGLTNRATEQWLTSHQRTLRRGR
jgi:hypothetical protein